MYTIGSTDTAMVKQIQEALRLPVDGIFGSQTFQAVVMFQGDHGLVADGVVGPKTLHELGILDTDLKNQLSFTTNEGLIIQKHHLPPGEFIRSNIPILNDYLVLHHTAGWEDPKATIDCWGNDTRGAIGTEFVIGGERITNGNTEHDGVVVQAFPEGCAGWHIGTSGNFYMNKHAVGIETCNFGMLTESGKTYVGTLAKESQIVTLPEMFKGYQKWHKYSDKQIYSLKRLILYIASRDNIDVRKGLVEWILKEGPTEAFDFHQEAYMGTVKGMFVHANIRKDKWDMFPQQELVDMLLSL